MPRLEATGISAVGLPWETTADEAAMLDRLRSGSLTALVVDTNFVDYVAATQCEFLAVGTPFSIGDQVCGVRKPVEVVEGGTVVWCCSAKL